MKRNMLRTLVASLVVETVMVVILFVFKIPGPALTAWYRQLGPSAWAMDVLSVYVCVHAANLLVSPRYIPLAAVGIQVAHDLAFGTLLASVPRGTMKVLDLFKDYARLAIVGYDAFIILSAVATDRLLERVPTSLYEIVGGVAAYVSLLFVDSF